MTGQGPLPPAVVLGLSPTGLYAIRELGAAGIPVIGVGAERQAGAASRFLHDLIIEPDEQKRLDRLLERCARHSDKAFLVPTSDQDLEFIFRNRQDLAQHCVFPDSYADGLAERILTKADFYRLCAEHGVAYPSLHEVQRSDILGLSASLEFPVLIKPSRVHDIKTEMRGRKGWVARDNADYADLIASIPDHAGTLLVQEIVPGPESEITLFTAYFDQEGRAHQSFTCRKLRQYPPGFGSASLVVSEDEPETREIAERFLAKIGYRGIAGVELKRDPRTGVRKMIEINPRPSLWFSASTASGKTITLAAYKDLAGCGARQPETDQRNGVVWKYPLKDSYSAMFYRLKKDFILPPPNTSAAKVSNFRVSPVSVPGDRGPGALELMNYIRKAVRRLLPKRK